MFIGTKYKLKRGAKIETAMPATEEMRRAKANVSQIIKRIKVSMGEKAQKTPAAVATPLPPLNLKKIGNIWPTTTAMAMIQIASSVKPRGEAY